MNQQQGHCIIFRNLNQAIQQRIFLKSAILLALSIFAIQAVASPTSPTISKTALQKTSTKTSTIPAKATVSHQPKPGEREFLWKLSSESGATLYVLGTIHVVKPDFYPLPVEMENAFQKSRAILMELDMSKQDKEKTQALVRQNGVYTGTENLFEHSSPETQKNIQTFCANNKLSPENFIRMKPWLASITILQLELARLGYHGSDGIDLHFTAEAAAQGKKVIGLETEEFQLNLFANLPQDLQELMLKRTLLDISTLSEDAGMLMKAWKDGDDQEMEGVMNKDLKEYPELAPVEEKIIYERNISMAQKLEPYLKGHDTFMVAIGSGHLVGNRSVIELLKQKGFKATQMHSGDPI